MATPSPILLHRAILLRRPRPDTVVGWLEDPFHHFGVTLEHEDGRVRAVRVRAIRLPWTTCAGAALPLRRIEGLPLARRPSELSRELQMAEHCTHIFELAALAMAHAALDRAERRYDAIVRGRPETGAAGPSRRQAVLRVEGQAVLGWTVVDGIIRTPAPAAGQSLTEGFHSWIGAMADEDAEHAWLLRRAAWLTFGSARYISARVATETDIGAVCHTFREPQRSCAQATRHSYRPYGIHGPPQLSEAGVEP